MLLTIRANYIWLGVEEWEKKSSREYSSDQCSSAADAWQAGVYGHASRSMDSRSRSYGTFISVNFESCGFG